MFAIINFAILSSNSYYQNIHNRKNVIKNTCEFNTIRFKREHANCLDLGQYQKYCNDNNLANEFVVTREIGVGNKPVYTIKPTAMWEEFDNNRYKKADFYYNFYCDERDNEPQLQLNIIPTPGYDISFQARLLGIFVVILCACLLLIILAAMCPCLFDECNDNFSDGFFLGILASNLGSSGNRRTYCE